jgi:hypothetical protein
MALIIAAVGTVSLLAISRRQPTYVKPETLADDLMETTEHVIDAQLIKRNFESNSGPTRPYHISPSNIVNDKKMSISGIKKLYQDSLNQIGVNLKNIVYTFDPYVMPSVNDNKVAIIQADGNEPDSQQVMRNSPMESYVGSGRFVY